MNLLVTHMYILFNMITLLFISIPIYHPQGQNYKNDLNCDILYFLMCALYFKIELTNHSYLQSLFSKKHKFGFRTG